MTDRHDVGEARATHWLRPLERLLWQAEWARTSADCRIGEGPWRYLARNGDVTLINDKINNSCGAASPTASTKLTYTGTTTAAPGASEIRSGSGVDSRRGSVPCVPRRLSISSARPPGYGDRQPGTAAARSQGVGSGSGTRVGRMTDCEAATAAGSMPGPRATVGVGLWRAGAPNRCCGSPDRPPRSKHCRPAT